MSARTWAAAAAISFWACGCDEVGAAGTPAPAPPVSASKGPIVRCDPSPVCPDPKAPPPWLSEPAPGALVVPEGTSEADLVEAARAVHRRRPASPYVFYAGSIDPKNRVAAVALRPSAQKSGAPGWAIELEPPARYVRLD